MRIDCHLNNEQKSWDLSLPVDLATLLRRNGYLSIKVGCNTGDCGSCLVLLDGEPIMACTIPAQLANRHSIVTLEGLGNENSLHPLQEAFLATGAVQCGFCTPAMILASKALLDRYPFATEAQVRAALREVLCRCTGYQHPVEAVLKVTRGGDMRPPRPEKGRSYVGRNLERLDGLPLVTGAAVFTDDVDIPEMLHGKILWSPHAHAIIRDIRADRALALPGVHAILSYKNVVRLPYTRAGQERPEPSPADYFLFDDRVRYIGDRVAAVAAASLEIADQALALIEVDYEVQPAVFTPTSALKPSAPKIHGELDTEGIYDRQRNICAHERVEIGDIELASQCADLEVEHTYRTHRVQHAQLEPHVCISYLNRDGRLTVRASTQVPFLLQEKLAHVLSLPIEAIQVIKPRVGGGFGGKQEVILEDVCAALTLATGRAVRLALSRREEFTAARCRHPMEIRLRTGLKASGDLVFNEMTVLADAGAYGSHSPTVAMNAGAKNLPRYPCRAMSFEYTVAYTNNIIAGAFRGYGTPQGAFALETQIDHIAGLLKIDPVQYRLQVCVRSGQRDYLSPHFYGPPAAVGVGWEFQGANLELCLRVGAEACDWLDKRANYSLRNRQQSRYKKGIGVACVSQGSGVAGAQRAGASIQLTADGSFLLSMESGEIGTGSETGLVQIAADSLAVPVSRIRLSVGDTDRCPFSSGTYASGTTFLFGSAIISAAKQLIEQIIGAAGSILGLDPALLSYRSGAVSSEAGGVLPLAVIAAYVATVGRAQLRGSATGTAETSPAPFAAQFADIEVDVQTGLVTVVDFLSVVDAGVIVNPMQARGQIEGAVAQGIGFALLEEIVTDGLGRVRNPSLKMYRVLRADEMPRLRTVFVEGRDPVGPMGTKALAEVGINGPAPAIGNALHHATGIRIRQLPLTPPRLRSALRREAAP